MGECEVLREFSAPHCCHRHLVFDCQEGVVVGIGIDHRDTSGVQGLIIALSNTYGLLFVIFLLGPGLVELPIKSCLLLFYYA